ncbi:MAG: hypothetical protein ACFE0J_11215 [Elainellaceae cyanobacterium]
MTASQPLRLTLDWRSAAASLPPEIQEQQTQNLYRALRQLPDVEKIERIADPDAPDGGMGAAWLKDLLFAEVNLSNLGKLFNIIRQRLPGTPIDFEIEVDGQKKRISMDGVRPEDFDAALDTLVKAANAMTSDQK